MSKNCMALIDVIHPAVLAMFDKPSEAINDSVLLSPNLAVTCLDGERWVLSARNGFGKGLLHTPKSFEMTDAMLVIVQDVKDGWGLHARTDVHMACHSDGCDITFKSDGAYPITMHLRNSGDDLEFISTDRTCTTLELSPNIHPIACIRKAVALESLCRIRTSSIGKYHMLAVIMTTLKTPIGFNDEWFYIDEDTLAAIESVLVTARDPYNFVLWHEGCLRVHTDTPCNNFVPNRFDVERTAFSGVVSVNYVEGLVYANGYVYDAVTGYKYKVPLSRTAKSVAKLLNMQRFDGADFDISYEVRGTRHAPIEVVQNNTHHRITWTDRVIDF